LPDILARTIDLGNNALMSPGPRVSGDDTDSEYGGIRYVIPAEAGIHWYWARKPCPYIYSLRQAQGKAYPLPSRERMLRASAQADVCQTVGRDWGKFEAPDL